MAFVVSGRTSYRQWLADVRSIKWGTQRRGEGEGSWTRVQRSTLCGVRVPRNAKVQEMLIAGTRGCTGGRTVGARCTSDWFGEIPDWLEERGGRAVAVALAKSCDGLRAQGNRQWAAPVLLRGKAVLWGSASSTCRKGEGRICSYPSISISLFNIHTPLLVLVSHTDTDLSSSRRQPLFEPAPFDHLTLFL
ncbi:hypothetical protein FA13DRAFT_1514139 [Coprinellus micaceus]|uniref:Uncharacterized protein n=1 Tax=Coprinellus micaceus TaxID=71717 RepID=A0A4Y7SKI4_COPMI|nr:hypothetical protein FA13DRAFT_1514139 [Coprinellus micaceus]